VRAPVGRTRACTWACRLPHCPARQRHYPGQRLPIPSRGRAPCALLRGACMRAGARARRPRACAVRRTSMKSRPSSRRALEQSNWGTCRPRARRRGPGGAAFRGAGLARARPRCAQAGAPAAAAVAAGHPSVLLAAENCPFALGSGACRSETTQQSNRSIACLGLCLLQTLLWQLPKKSHPRCPLLLGKPGFLACAAARALPCTARSRSSSTGPPNSSAASQMAHSGSGTNGSRYAANSGRSRST